jgi:cytoskeletal protein RodZ
MNEINNPNPAPESEKNIQAGEKLKNNIPTVLGTIVIVILAVTIGIFAWKFFTAKKAAAPAVQPDQSESQSQTASQSETDQNQAAYQNSTAPSAENKTEASQENVDIDYELKQLDSQISPVNGSDFNEDNFSDSSLGV